MEGNYRYDDVNPHLKHIREVTWLKTITRSELDHDLLYSLGSSMTVCQIKRNNAENRIRKLLDNHLEKQDEKIIDSTDILYDKTYTGLAKDEIPLLYIFSSDTVSIQVVFNSNGLFHIKFLYC